MDISSLLQPGMARVTCVCPVRLPKAVLEELQREEEKRQKETEAQASEETAPQKAAAP